MTEAKRSTTSRWTKPKSPRPEKVTLRVGESEHEIRLTLNALCDIEDDFGEGFNQIIQRFASPGTVRLGDVRRFLRHSLREEDGTRVDPERADEIANSAGVAVCCEAVGRALMEALAGMGAVPAPAGDADAK
jgi:hypothetical protein